MTRRRLQGASALLLGLAALAWNPLELHNGEPRRWNTAAAVVWNPDGGPLGKLTNAQAVVMVADEFQKWEDVATAVIDYAQGVQIVDPSSGLPTNVTSANYSAVINAGEGQNPIIFDNDRDIFDMLAIPSSVVGFAGVLRSSGATITKAYVVMQGDWFDNQAAGTPPSDPGEVSEAVFRGAMVHEDGHFSGLHHSSVNHELTVTGLPGCPAPTSQQIETMGPTSNPDTLNLERDDGIGISVLYPTAAFQSDTAAIRGRLIDRDGTSAFAGANIVLRPDAADCNQRYEMALGMQSGAAPAEFGGAGSFSFHGLTPGGAYTLRATTILDGASYLIPPPTDLGGPDDFYNGGNEDWFSPPDDPQEVGTVTAPAAGQTLAGIDIRINNAGNPGEVLATLNVERLTAGSQQPKVLDDNDVDSASAFGGTAQAAWVNRFTPDPSELPLRIEGVDIMFWHGSVGVGRNVRILVYTDPAGSGNPANAMLVHQQDAQVQFLSTVSFNAFDLSAPVQVDAGEYYVGAFDLLADVEHTFIMSDDTDTASGRAYSQANSTSPAGYQLVPDRTWMVRARVRTVPPPGSVRLSWDLACNEAAVPDQDYAVYEGTIAGLRAGMPDHAAIACTTGRATTYGVQGAGDDRYWLVGPVLATREGSLGTGTGGSDRTPAATCRNLDPDPCP
jgi:hypothetical protein